MLAPAFPAPVIANQVVFRAVMDAVARPGEVKALPPAVGAPSPLNNTAALANVFMTLADNKVMLVSIRSVGQQTEQAFLDLVEKEESRGFARAYQGGEAA